jgi:hypothetical protein
MAHYDAKTPLNAAWFTRSLSTYDRDYGGYRTVVTYPMVLRSRDVNGRVATHEVCAWNDRGQAERATKAINDAIEAGKCAVCGG